MSEINQVWEIQPSNYIFAMKLHSCLLSTISLQYFASIFHSKFLLVFAFLVCTALRCKPLSFAYNLCKSFETHSVSLVYNKSVDEANQMPVENASKWKLNSIQCYINSEINKNELIYISPIKFNASFHLL